MCLRRQTAPLRALEQRVIEGFRGFHELDQILGSCRTVWSNWTRLRGRSVCWRPHPWKGKSFTCLSPGNHKTCPHMARWSLFCRQDGHANIPTMRLGGMISLNRRINHLSYTKMTRHQSNLASIPNFRFSEQRSHGREANLPLFHAAGTKTRYVQSNVREQRVPRE